MVFNSLSYFIFLPLVFLLFSLVRDRYRWLVLLLSSYVFYGFILKPVLLIALTAVILVTFRIGRLIEQSEERARRRSWLWVGVVINIALLVYFKYLPFITHNINLIFNALGVDIFLEKPSALVSIGLSFYIFQAISYLADIYFRMAKPEPHFGYFALYLSFFPKLLQGPIERAGDLLPQLKARYEFNYDNVRFGLLLFTWGLFKKVVIADRLGLYVDAVYNDVHAFTGLPLLLATYAYAFQIFMDFSGYTDMALGSARVFNLNLTQNFNGPYLATSVADFWRRWHISFSRWILDYIFEPLQMEFRNLGKWGIAASLLITFILAGLWHGANWTYIAFGLIHGIYLAASFLYKPYQKKLHKRLGIDKTRFLRIWQTLVTFNLVSFAWIFFRANNLGDAFFIIESTCIHFTADLKHIFVPVFARKEFLTLLISTAVLLAISYAKSNPRVITFFNSHYSLRWLSYNLLIFYILIFYVRTQTNFIYFNF
jgi:D-alanyl-lipoteichoic acid acyltransferase DltB (MBOAT superfamily)